MVGTAQSGPLDTPTLVTTPQQYLSTFGQPSVNQYGPFAALNYLRRGNQLYYTRVAKKYTPAVATIASLGTPGGDGKVYSVTVTAGHGITGPSGGNTTSWVRISEDGFKTSSNLPVTAVSTNVITFATPILDSYTSAATVDLSNTDSAANSAEATAYKRTSTVTPLVRFTATSPGAWANFGSGSGIELVVEDSGYFLTTKPDGTTDSLSGIPLIGTVTTAPAVDTKVALLALTATVVKSGELRGVNTDSVAAKLTNVAITSNVATVTLTDATGFTTGDSVSITGCSNAVFNVTSVTLTGKTSTTITFALTHADVASAAVTTGVASKDSSVSFGTVYKASVSGSTVTWAAVGVLTKRVRVYFKGSQVEVFENLIGYDETSLNYWDTVIGTPDAPVSKYVYAEYLGAAGEQPTNTYNKSKAPNGPRIFLGVANNVLQTDSSSATVLTFGNAAGADGSNPSSSDYIGTIGQDGTTTGLQVYRDTTRFDINLLCAPACTSADVIEELIGICEDRNDCLAILDTPLGYSVQEVVDWSNGTGSFTGDHGAFVSNKAAMYYPWVQVADPYTQRNIWLPPSAVVPAVFANSDGQANVWFAAAGTTRGKVDYAQNVQHACTQGEVDLMYGPGNGNAINPIMSFKQDGIVVYGNRTLQRVPSALDRINVRRMLFFVEKAIATASRKLVFEQDDPVLWGRFVALAKPFLQNLKGQRALEDFQVVCDATTNTPDRRNNNEVSARILLIPVKSAEKIVLEFTLLPSGASFSEFIAANPVSQ